MKIVNAIVAMLLVAGVRAGDNMAATGYTDTCDYTSIYVKCGDQCIYKENPYEANCQCGSSASDSFKPSGSDQYCCIPFGAESCILVSSPGFEYVVCQEGRNLSMSYHCDNTDRSLQCYNSYQDSQYLGEHLCLLGGHVPRCELV